MRKILDIQLLETTRIHEVLNVVDYKTLVFTPLTKEESNELLFELRRLLGIPKNSAKRRDVKNELLGYTGIDFEDIVALGDTNMETRQANNYIQNSLVTISGVVKRNYKCFVNKDWVTINRNLNLPYHEDGGCSWNCLMEKLRHPEFGIIYNIPSNLKLK